MKRFKSHDSGVTSETLKMARMFVKPGQEITTEIWNRSYHMVLSIAQCEMIVWKQNNLTGKQAI